MTTGEKIHKYRKELGLSQEELGKKLLVSRQTISLWEKDQTVPSIENLKYLKEIFGVSADELLGFESKEPKNENVIQPEQPRKNAWVIILLILGSPIWISLLIAAFSVIISVYVSVWTVIVSLWSIFASFIAATFYGLITGICYICVGNTLTGIALVGAGIVCLGLTLLLFLGNRAATKGVSVLTKKILLEIKNRFCKKEMAL